MSNFVDCAIISLSQLLKSIHLIEGYAEGATTAKIDTAPMYHCLPGKV
jgi:hypothetical protein